MGLILPASHLVYGPVCGVTPSGTTVNHNGADVRGMHRFVLDATKTLSTVSVSVSSVAGTLGANDAVCEIYACGVDGKPTGAALASSNTLSAAIATGTLATFTGFSLALTKGIHYVAVTKNVNGTPATNRFVVSFPNNNAAYSDGGTGGGWGNGSSTDAGVTWSLTTGGAGVGLVFSDATRIGFTCNGIVATGTAQGIHGTREAAIRCTTPTDFPMVVKGVCGHVLSKTGSPTGFLIGRVRLVSDNSILGSTYQNDLVPDASVPFALYFETPFTIPGGTDIRIVLGETTQSDANTDRYNAGGFSLFAGASAWLPDSMQGSYYDGSSWTDDPLTLFSLGLILDRAPAADPNYPVEDDVEDGVDFGINDEFTGTVTLPTEAQVESGVDFGADGTEFTGSLSASGGGYDGVFPVMRM